MDSKFKICNILCIKTYEESNIIKSSNIDALFYSENLKKLTNFFNCEIFVLCNNEILGTSVIKKNKLLNFYNISPEFILKYIDYYNNSKLTKNIIIEFDHNNKIIVDFKLIKNTYTKEDLIEFGKLVLDTFHSEGKTKNGKDRLPRIKYDNWINDKL